MRVVVQFGSRAGEVTDFPVPVARAMLADGRARPVHDDVSVVAQVAPATVPPERIDARADRGFPPSKSRRRR